MSINDATPEEWNAAFRSTKPANILKEAANCIEDRADERDTYAERSMLSTVESFNALYGTQLTEEQGWMLMVILKASRAKGGKFRLDDYVDGCAYFALAAEARNKDKKSKHYSNIKL